MTFSYTYMGRDEDMPDSPHAQHWYISLERFVIESICQSGSYVLARRFHA